MSETPPPDTGTPPPEPPPDTDWKAEAEKWQALARKHEGRAKSNAKELERVQQQSMTEQERAVAQARTEARTEALREVGAARVDDAVRLAAKGRHDDPDALLEGLDRAKFLDSEGLPDAKAIAAWVDRVAPAREEPTGFPDLGQGARGGGGGSKDPLLETVKQIAGTR